MEKETFLVVSKAGSADQSESSSSSSFVECLISSRHEKTLETSSTTISDSLGCDRKVLSAEHSLCPEIIDNKLHSLLSQTTQLTEKFESRNASLRKTLTQINGKQQEFLKGNKTAQKEKEYKEAMSVSDYESDYSIIPLENNPQTKVDESTAFQDTLLELHALKDRHAKVTQELVEEQLRTNSLTKLLEEKDEQNRILKEFFDISKQRVQKNVQLQSELDSVKKEAEQLHKKCEEKEGEVETYKKELLNLQTSHTNIKCSLQAEIELLQETLRSAKHQEDADRINSTDMQQKLEKLSENNHEMGEQLSVFKIETDNLTELLKEKDEQNKILKEFFDISKQRGLKNVQLQSELDSVRKEAEQLHKKCEEKVGEVETYKEELLNLQTSHTNIKCSLQAEIELLQETLRSAKHQQDADRINLTDMNQKLEKLSEDNHKMVEQISALKIETDNLTKLLEEKDEKNRSLKELYDTLKQQVLKNVQLQSELDSIRKEAEQLYKKCEEKEGEVDCKEELLNLQTSHTNIKRSLQAEIEILQETLRSAKHKQNANRIGRRRVYGGTSTVQNSQSHLGNDKSSFNNRAPVNDDCGWNEDNKMIQNNWQSDSNNDNRSSKKACFVCHQSGHISKNCPRGSISYVRNGYSAIDRKLYSRKGSGCFKDGQHIHIYEDCSSGGDRKRVCFKCGEEGHISRECPSGGGNDRSRTCFKCGEEGHMSRKCPSGSGSKSCFKCRKEGHMSRECPYGGGGGNDRKSLCDHCGEEGHIIWDCPSVE